MSSYDKLRVPIKHKSPFSRQTLTYTHTFINVNHQQLKRGILMTEQVINDTR